MKALQQPMNVEFLRTAARSYAVKIHRGQLPPVEMDPAPGYDPEMPHDLLHLIVECELGLRRGIFGQVAAGGDAGTFHQQTPSEKRQRETARNRRRMAKRGDKLRMEGRGEAAASERATYICLYTWLARSDSIDRKARAAQMASEAAHVRATQPSAERQALSDGVLARVCERLDELSSRWSSLKVGERLTVEWRVRN